MSVWEEEWEDYECDKHDFEIWLDSINKTGDPEKDEEVYNEWADAQAEEIKQAEYPEWVISTPNYTMTISNN